MIIRFLILLSFFGLFSSCNNSTQPESKQQNSKQVNLTYAKRFKIKQEADYTILEILGNKTDTAVTATFVLYNHTKPNYSKEAFYIKTPVKRVASMSSIYTTMIEQLNELQSIVAIDNIDYYSNPLVQADVNSGKIKELSKGPKLEIEKTIALNPDLMLSFGMGNPKNDIEQKILLANIPTAISLDHLEETPLARYEWIKFVACFYNKLELADSLFKQTELNYNELKKLAQTAKQKPSVITEIKYGDVWYMPGGKSYVANLLKDAGANYLWQDDASTGSNPLSFETVYNKAKDCDVWVNLYNINSKKELASYDERYALFKAYRTGQLYNNNKTQNSKGFSNFWESGINQPANILKDLIYIFHPELIPNHTLTFYKKIE